MNPVPTATPVSTEELYNLLMREIEPELTTDMLPLLDDMYASESADEREARGEWYEIAFELFTRKHDDFVQQWKNEYEDIRRQANAAGRTIKEKNDKDDIGSIERSIAQS